MQPRDGATATLPDWVKAGAIAYHVPAGVMFVAVRCVQRRDGSIALIDAPLGTKGNEYLLLECRQPTLEDCRAGLVTTHQNAMSITCNPHPCGELLVISDGKRRVGVLVPDEVRQSAIDLAKAFDGVVLDEVEVPF